MAENDPIQAPPARRIRWPWLLVVAGAVAAAIGSVDNAGLAALAFLLLWFGFSKLMPIRNGLLAAGAGILTALVALTAIQVTTDPDGVKRRSDRMRQEEAKRAATATAAAAAVARSRPEPPRERRESTKLLRRADFGDRWPFTVEQGYVMCVSGSAVVFRANDATYAINGQASGMAARNGFRPAEDIWRENPSIPGTRINIKPVIDAGLALCE